MARAALPSARQYGSWLAAVRIYTGAFWFIHGVLKIASGSFAGPNGMMVNIIKDMTSKTSGPYHDFLINYVLTHAALFGQLVQWGETLTGVSLILGLLTRLGSVIGTFLALNYWAAKGSFGSPMDYAAIDILAAVMSIIHAVLPTGRIFGLDGAFARRR